MNLLTGSPTTVQSLRLVPSHDVLSIGFDVLLQPCKFVLSFLILYEQRRSHTRSKVLPKSSIGDTYADGSAAGAAESVSSRCHTGEREHWSEGLRLGWRQVQVGGGGEESLFKGECGVREAGFGG